MHAKTRQISTVKTTSPADPDTNPAEQKNIMATESTEEHGKINALRIIFSCSSVDSVAIYFVFSV